MAVAIQRLIREGFPEHSIKDVAIQQGMKTLYSLSQVDEVQPMLAQ